MPHARMRGERRAAAAVRRAALARFASITSSSSKMSSVASAARQASALPVYECECRKPRVDRVVVERFVDGVARQHDRERQVAAGNALRQAQEVRRDAGLLVGEERAGAPEAGHDLVGDEVHLVAVAQRARAAQVLGVVHRHAGRALHQRLDDQRRGFAVVPLEMPLQVLRAAHGVVARGLALLRARASPGSRPGCSS